MKLKELQLLSEALWVSVKSDLKFFSPIQVFVKKLSEVDFSDASSITDIKMYSDKIEEFFKRYRPTPNSGLYFPPAETSTNDTTVKTIYNIVQQLNSLPEEELLKEFESIKPKPQLKSKGLGKIFIGHVEGITTPEKPAKGILTGKPISAHATTRLEEEKLLFDYKETGNFEAVSLRLGMVYGRGILMIDAARWFSKYNLLGIWKEPTW